MCVLYANPYNTSVTGFYFSNHEEYHSKSSVLTDSFGQPVEEYEIDYIEGGWPGANPTDNDYFSRKLKFTNSRLTAFGMTRRPGRSADNDPGLNALINSQASTICLVGKASLFQVEEALGITKDENLSMIKDSINQIKKKNKEPIFDAEHFFDGFKQNSEYAINCIETAFNAGARWIVLCDTNGGTLPDEIYNLACPASPIHYQRDPIQTTKTSVLGAINMLGLAKQNNARIFQASTSEVYGDPLEHPQTEGYWGNVNPIGPRGVYDEAKRFAEAISMAYHRYHNIDTKIVRIFNTYGPRMRLNDGRAIPNFLKQALTGKELTAYGDGSQTRSFCYVSDLIEGIHRLLMSNINDPINIGNPIEMTIQQMAEKILQATGSHSKISYKPLPEDDPKVRQPNIEKAVKYLAWEPQVNLDQGLKTTIDYFKIQLGIESS